MGGAGDAGAVGAACGSSVPATMSAGAARIAAIDGAFAVGGGDGAAAVAGWGVAVGCEPAAGSAEAGDGVAGGLFGLTAEADAWAPGFAGVEAWEATAPAVAGVVGGAPGAGGWLAAPGGVLVEGFTTAGGAAAGAV